MEIERFKISTKTFSDAVGKIFHDTSLTIHQSKSMCEFVRKWEGELKPIVDIYRKYKPQIDEKDTKVLDELQGFMSEKVEIYNIKQSLIDDCNCKMSPAELMALQNVIAE